MIDTETLRAKMGRLVSRATPEPPDRGPEEDVHSDPDAEVGDKRIYVRPMGEVFGYEKEHHRKQFMVTRQTYEQNATYHSGAVHYGWREGRKIFHGTIDDWEATKENPEAHFEDIPVVWDQIVTHVDKFIEIHGEELQRSEYPHGVLTLQ